MFAEKAEGQARQPFTLVNCPGMKEFSDLTSVADTAGLNNRGFVKFSGTEYTVVGSFLLSTVSGGTPTLVASGIAGSGPVSFVADNNELVIITESGFDDYLFDGTNLSQFTGANIQEWRDGDIIDGYGIYVPTNPGNPGRAWYTEVNQLNTIGASNFYNAESEPDALHRVKVLDRLIWHFGENSLEPFYTTGDSTAPFARHADGIEQYGLGAVDSIARLNKKAAFVAVSRQSRPHIRMIAGGTSQRISNNAIDAVIDSGTYSDALGFAYEQRGNEMFNFIFPTLGRSFSYNSTTGFWHEPQSGVGLVGSWDARQCTVAHDKVLVGHKTDGKIYELDFDTHTDAGTSRMAMFTARLPSSGEYWNRLDKVLLDISVGVGASGATVEPQIIMEMSRDGGQTWGDERWRGLGFSGDYDRQVKWSGCGRFRHGDLRFRITEAVAREVTAVHASGRPGRMV